MRRPAASLVAVAIVAIACSSSTSPDEGPALPIGWVKGAAESVNGPAPNVDLQSACGSTTATYLAELQSTPAFAAKVLYHWGDCVEGGKQILLGGTVATTHLGPTDLPMDHPFGDDLSMDVDLDDAFVGFGKNLSTGATEKQTHVEISNGLIPHVPRPPNTPTGQAQTWQEASIANLDLASFQPGFAEPDPGDRAIFMGRWIIDCGHDNFSAELHALSFVAWAHTDVPNAKTTARLYYNPYRDTELYSRTGDRLGAVTDPGRLGDALTFPKQLVREVLGLDDGSVDKLRALENIEATHAPIADFRVCAPEGTSGSSIAVASDLVTRPGVTVTLTQENSAGCVKVHVAGLDTYAPMDVPMRTCLLPWAYLDDIVKDQVSMQIDLLAKIQANVSTPAGKMRAALDPETGCGDALAGPPVTDAPAGQSTRVEPTQPFPVYGVVTVTRR
jgi:hypothetical protein